MKPITKEIRNKIQMYIKNAIDISNLIRDVDIRGENLSGAIIEDFNRVKENLSGTNFSRCVIGNEGKIANLSNSKLRNCIFQGTKFIGKTFIRHCDCRGSDFSESDCPQVEWQYSDVTNCNFCETLLRLGTDYFYRAKVDQNLFRDLTKYLNIEVRMKEPLINVEFEREYQSEEKWKK